jgi:hypothetical protein
MKHLDKLNKETMFQQQMGKGPTTEKTQRKKCTWSINMKSCLTSGIIKDMHSKR